MDKVAELVGISAASPVMFPYVEKDGTVLIDGVAIATIDAWTAVDRCKEIVHDEADITLDIILNHNSKYFFHFLLFSKI
jgi:hypothetical protein